MNYILKNSFKKNLEGYLFISPWLFGFIFLSAGPILFSLLMSGTRLSLLSAPQWIGLENYETVLFNDPLVYNSLWNTAYYVLFSVPLGMMLSLFLAILLNQRLPTKFYKNIHSNRFLNREKSPKMQLFSNLE